MAYKISKQLGATQAPYKWFLLCQKADVQELDTSYHLAKWQYYQVTLQAKLETGLSLPYPVNSLAISYASGKNCCSVYIS